MRLLVLFFLCKFAACIWQLLCIRKKNDRCLGLEEKNWSKGSGGATTKHPPPPQQQKNVSTTATISFATTTANERKDDWW
jgi:hypothetical protein